MSDLIQQTIDNNVLLLEICRNNKKNALTTAMYTDLADAIQQASENEQVRVIVLTGGENFSAGNDLKDFLNNPPASIDAPVFRFMDILTKCPLPVVTAVDGAAVGIGTTLLLHTDLNYCTARTRFSLPFVNLGLVPEYASSLLLPKMIGHAKAAELIMLGEPFSAEQALNIGLVNAIFEPQEVLAQAMTTAQKLAAKPPNALRQTKALLKGNITAITERIHAEADVFRERLASKEAQQIMAAFFK